MQTAFCPRRVLHHGAFHFSDERGKNNRLYFLSAEQLESGGRLIQRAVAACSAFVLELQFRFRRQVCNQQEVVINFSCLLYVCT